MDFMAREGGRAATPDPRFVGCCGAYCRTCRSFVLGSCRGCKLGYEDGQRDIARARCRIKLCCYARRKLETCAECPESDGCEMLGAFHRRKWREYAGYRRSLEFIRENGYAAFAGRAKGWTKAYGDLDCEKKRRR